MNRRERQRRDDRRAVAVRDDRARPAAVLPLRLEHVEVRRIHLGDDERDVGVHPVVLRVGQHRACRRARTPARRRRRRGVERGEHDVGRHTATDRTAPPSSRDVRRHVTRADPASGLGVGLPRRALGSGHFRELEPRMVREQPNECLADRARGAEHGDARRCASAMMSSMLMSTRAGCERCAHTKQRRREAR